MTHIISIFASSKLTVHCLTGLLFTTTIHYQFLFLRFTISCLPRSVEDLSRLTRIPSRLKVNLKVSPILTDDLACLLYLYTYLHFPVNSNFPLPPLPVLTLSVRSYITQFPSQQKPLFPVKSSNERRGEQNGGLFTLSVIVRGQCAQKLSFLSRAQQRSECRLRLSSETELLLEPQSKFYITSEFQGPQGPCVVYIKRQCFNNVKKYLCSVVNRKRILFSRIPAPHLGFFQNGDY